MKPTKKVTMYMIVRNGLFWHEGNHPNFCSLYDNKGQIDKVVIEEDKKGKSQYWAWWDHEKEIYRMVYPSRVQVEMCFPYGYKIEEEKGNGRLCRVKIKSLETINPLGNKWVWTK